MNSRIVLAFVATMLAAVSAPAQDEKPAPTPPDKEAAADDTKEPHLLEGLWELRMERHVWWPYSVPGSLAVARGPHGIHASVTFDPMWGIDPKHLTVDPAAGDLVRFTLDLSDSDREVVTGTVKDGVFVGEIEWVGAKPQETCFISASRLAPMRRFEPDTATDPFPVETDPTRVGVDPAALDRLILYASRYDTDALIVVKDGKLICDRTFLRPRCVCGTESITQVVASLAIPLLIEDHKLPRDLDTPLTLWFPEWKGDALKSKITLRQVLTHTTGLAYGASKDESDFLADALGAPARREPGSRFEVNAQAMELLSGIIAKAAGEQADTYLGKRLFRPLGISRWRWPRDAAGNAPTYGGLDLGPWDLARIGALVANRGRVKDAQIVPAWWFDEAATSGAVNDEAGLAWTLLRDQRTETVVQTQARLDQLNADGFADAARLAPLVGKTFGSRRAWWTAVTEILGEDGVKQLAGKLPYPAVGGELRGPVSCIYLAGTGGQFLLVAPAQHLVVVRQRRPFAKDELPADIAQRAEFSDLPRLAQDLLW